MKKYGAQLIKYKFQILVGIAASLGFITLSYAVLRMNSSLGMVYLMTTATYFYFYVGLTVATAILFGINLSLLISQWRTYGIKNIFAQSGNGLAAIVGIVASSCPVCGSTLLSLVATASGITFLSTAGLELKIISFVLILLATVYTYRKYLVTTCDTANCPVPIRNSFSKISYLPVALMLVLFIGINLKLLSSDPIKTLTAENQDYSLYSCSTKHE